MYAIIATGGKQYKVESGMKLEVEKLEANVGDIVKFDVLMVSDEAGVSAGNPTVAGAYAEAEVLAQGKGKKIIVFKYKAKKNERKRQGHRQPFTQVLIKSIVK
ncbi:MAG: 50S ribosomal protein L21 [Clostridia bacterium]|nr:50S ribosomal protein L21 [Clostridia bacterium]